MQDEWNSPSQLRHFSAVRKLDNQPFPAGGSAKRGHSACCAAVPCRLTCRPHTHLPCYGFPGKKPAADQWSPVHSHQTLLTGPLGVGFDAEVRRANQSDIGKRNGGAMLSMQVGSRPPLARLPSAPSRHPQPREKSPQGQCVGWLGIAPL